MKRDLDALTRETFDLLILGGGITGAGVAFDAATRGWRVALIDKGDFASGTSSVSSKLVHGGLRYLEHGHFHLVYEALQERGWLLKAAPHIVRPLQFLLPFYQGARVPSWKWRLGLTLYDLLAGKANIERSRPLSSQSLTKVVPGLRGAGLRGGAAYFDAQMDDARLCLAVLQSAVAAGAVIANYVEAVSFQFAGTAIAGVVARDSITGAEFPIRTRQVLNATGPWVDSLCRMAGEKRGPFLEPTKGVHIVLPDQRLASALLLLHPRDGRVFFVIPWLGKTLVGTTDTFSHQGPDALSVLPEELAYLREGWRHYFPDQPEPPILGAFAGLRPLLRAKPGEPSAKSREFRIFRSPSGLVSVAGGKYTTFRAMAEAITNRLARRLGKRSRCRTRRLILAGSPAGAWHELETDALPRLTRELSIDLATARRLLDRYGMNVWQAARYLTPRAARRPVVPGEPELVGEWEYQREHEMAVRPEDHWLRRTRLGLYVSREKLDMSG